MGTDLPLLQGHIIVSIRTLHVAVDCDGLHQLAAIDWHTVVLVEHHLVASLGHQQAEMIAALIPIVVAADGVHWVA
jgi:hypothetical protein